MLHAYSICSACWLLIYLKYLTGVGIVTQLLFEGVAWPGIFMPWHHKSLLRRYFQYGLVYINTATAKRIKFLDKSDVKRSKA